MIVEDCSTALGGRVVERGNLYVPPLLPLLAGTKQRTVRHTLFLPPQHLQRLLHPSTAEQTASSPFDPFALRSGCKVVSHSPTMTIFRGIADGTAAGEGAMLLDKKREDGERSRRQSAVSHNLTAKGSLGRGGHQCSITRYTLIVLKGR